MTKFSQFESEFAKVSCLQSSKLVQLCLEAYSSKCMDAINPYSLACMSIMIFYPAYSFV